MSLEKLSKISQFLENLNSDTEKSSQWLATNALEAVGEIINSPELWTSVEQLISLIKELNQQLKKANCCENVTENIILRMLKVIRDECLNWCSQEKVGRKTMVGPSNINKQVLTDVVKSPNYFNEFRQATNEALNELRLELDTSVDKIAKQAKHQISGNEVVLTIGRSKSVEAFLKRAAKNNKELHVIVVQETPFCKGRELAHNLVKADMNCSVISDSDIEGIMPQVTKVVIGVRSVMADGGLKAVCGSYSIGLMAKQYSVPLIVCTPTYKLSPQYFKDNDPQLWNRYLAPETLLSYSKGQCAHNSNTIIPVFDYVPAELVSELVSNTGSNPPSYLYRLLAEIYHSDDILISSA